MTPDPGAELMLKFQRGDEEAFIALFREYKNQTFHLAFRYLNDAARAEDIVSEAFLRVYRAKERYKAEAKFTSWLYRIVANLCLNELRSIQRLRPLEPRTEEDEAPKELADTKDLGPDASVAQTETSKAVAAALQALPETQRMLVILVYYQDMSITDAAQIVGISAVGARLRLFRARAALKRKLRSVA